MPQRIQASDMLLWHLQAPSRGRRLYPTAHCGGFQFFPRTVNLCCCLSSPDVQSVLYGVERYINIQFRTQVYLVLYGVEGYMNKEFETQVYVVL